MKMPSSDGGKNSVESCDANTNACELSGDVDNDGIVDAEDPCPDEARNLCAGDIATDRSKNLPIRINSGSSRATCAGDKTDCNGDRWYADFGYAKRLGTSSCTLAGACTLDGIEEIMGCVDTSTEDVFQCDHVGSRATGRVAYGFDVPDGKYIVNAYFAATQIGDDVGKRVFDITVEGETVYQRFDPVVAAGGIGVVVVRSVAVDVVDGNGLKVTFQPRVGEVAVKAIEVLDAR